MVLLWLGGLPFRHLSHGKATMCWDSHSMRQAWREWNWIRTSVTAGCWALQRAAILPICPLPDSEVTRRFLSASREDRTKCCFESSALLRTCLPTALKRRGEGQVWEGVPGAESTRTEGISRSCCGAVRRQEELTRG